MGKLRVGVVGVGHLGFHHARNYARMGDVDLVGVADVNPEKLEQADRMLGVRGFKDAEDLIPLVDAVSVAVPTTAHHSVGSQFLAKGIHTLVEKPLASTVEEGAALFEMARSSGAVLHVGHVERYNPAIRAVASYIQNPRFIECHRLAPFVPRNVDIDVVLDLMVHDIDLALSFARAPVERVYASGVAVLTSKEDIANARLEFMNGCVANLTASRVSRDKLRKVRVFQSNCYFSIDCLNRNAEVYAKADEPEGRGILSALGGGASISPGGVDPMGLIVRADVSGDDEEPLYVELRDFVLSIAEKRQPLVSGEEGLATLEVALKVLERLRD